MQENIGKEYFLKENEFIVSKTDKTGKITYCNEPFMRLAKAKLDELLYKPHNINCFGIG